MTGPAIKIGVTGAHSTGKSGFVSALEDRLTARGLVVKRVADLARRARDLGFPILTNHTVDSTFWIMAECMRQEAEASLTADVILIDRPVVDALGYLLAALDVTGRNADAGRLDRLRAIAMAYTGDYDLLLVTALDPTIPLGDGRDPDVAYRAAAAAKIESLVRACASDAWRLGPDNAADRVDAAEQFVLARRPVS